MDGIDGVFFIVGCAAFFAWLGHGVGGVSERKDIAQSCDRHGVVYIRDVRYYCKQEPTPAAKEQR